MNFGARSVNGKEQYCRHRLTIYAFTAALSGLRDVTVYRPRIVFGLSEERPAVLFLRNAGTLEEVLGARAVQSCEASEMSAGWKGVAGVFNLHPRITAMESDLKALKLAVPKLFRVYPGAGRERAFVVNTPELREFGKQLWQELAIE